jgi:3-phenylpropionate/trans-cinnamate dioxygenase ferredoxin component
MTDLTYHTLGPADAIAEGRMKGYDLVGRSVVVCRTKDGYYALDNVCSHGVARLDEGRLRGVRLICPLHGASFDCRTGAVMAAPATVPIASHPVRIVEGTLEVGLPA